jgi:hypothetical protein
MFLVFLFLVPNVSCVTGLSFLECPAVFTDVFCSSVNVYLFLIIFVPDGNNILVIFVLQNFFHGIPFHIHYNYSTCKQNLYVDEYNFHSWKSGVDFTKSRKSEINRKCYRKCDFQAFDWLKFTLTTDLRLTTFCEIDHRWFVSLDWFYLVIIKIYKFYKIKINII